MATNRYEPEPLSNDYYFLLQSLIFDSDNDIFALEDQIISLIQKGSQNTIKYIEFLLSKTSKVQFWKIPSLLHLSASLESRLKIELKLDFLLLKYKKFNESNQNKSFSEFCVEQAADQSKDIISILSTDDSDKLTESHFQDKKKKIIFDSREHKLIDLLFEFRSLKCIQKFNIKPSEVDLAIGLKCQTRADFENDTQSKSYFPYYSRQSWFFGLFEFAVTDSNLMKYNYTNLILPTRLAKKHILYGPHIVRKEVRRSIFGEESQENYNKLVHYADLIWRKEKFEFEENLQEPFLVILLSNIISLYCVKKPKEYEYVLDILKKISHQITDKIFHSLPDSARPIKPMLIKIGCDYRTEAEKKFDFYPYDNEFQVRDRDFFDYFHTNPGFTKDEFVQNREKIFDTRFCIGFGYTFYEDNVDEFIKIYESDDKKDCCYDMFFEELYLIDVAAWFGAEKIYSYLKDKCNKKMSAPYLAFYGENEKIINDCLNEEMNEYQRSRLVVKLLLDRKFDLAVKICENNSVSDISIRDFMFVPLDVIKKIKGVKVSAKYYLDDNFDLVSYWLTFIDENNLDAEYQTGKLRIIGIDFEERNRNRNRKAIPQKLIL